MEEKKTNLEENELKRNNVEEKVSKEANKNENATKKEETVKVKDAKIKEQKNSKTEVKDSKGKEEKMEVKKSDTDFKKVQNKVESKKKIDEIEQNGKKSHVVTKALLIFIMIFIAAYCVFFARNLIILNSIASKIEEYKDTTCYSYVSVNKSDVDVIETKINYYKKDNIERFDYQRDDINLIWWYDSN